MIIYSLHKMESIRAIYVEKGLHRVNYIITKDNV